MPKRDYGDWKIVRSLPESGQAFIYIVKKSKDNDQNDYILKRLKNIKRIERFKREIEIVTRLSHPNIVTIIDSNYKGTTPYLVIDYYSKGTLEDLDLKGYNLFEKLQLFIGICEGVAYAHTNGVIHRDLKPSNIFIDDNESPIVGDFGICFVDDMGERFTLLEEAVGPRNFMAPELEDGRFDDISPASDVYSLGKILYWLLAGKIFSREKHREENYDLTKIYNSSDYYMINKLLDNMIVFEHESRYKNGTIVLEETKILLERIKMKAHEIDLKAPQPCLYCGKGNYQIAVTSSKNQGKYLSMDLGNFGFQAVGNPYWHIFVCDYCGNVQLFRTDYAKSREVWEH